MNQNAVQRIGLLAGAGDIPVYFARKASDKGIQVISIAFSDDIETSLAPYSQKHFSIGIGQANKILSTLREHQVQDLVILGKVDKTLIFQKLRLDMRALKIWNQLRNKEDKTLMEGILSELESEGLKTLDQRELLKELFPGAGVLTQKKPTKKELEEIAFGLPIAKQLADMEIGQTLVVKEKTVVAVEAAEGTNPTIERGCRLANGNGVVIKVSRTHQDFRYDCPGVGPETMEHLAKHDASVLALEAGRVMVVEQEQSIALANRAGFSIVCV